MCVRYVTETSHSVYKGLTKGVYCKCIGGKKVTSWPQL